MKKIIRLLSMIMVLTLVFSGCKKSTEDSTAADPGKVTAAPSGAKTPAATAAPSSGRSDEGGSTAAIGSGEATNSAAADDTSVDAPAVEPEAGSSKASDEAIPYISDSTIAMFDAKAGDGSLSYGDLGSGSHAEGSYSTDAESTGFFDYVGETSGSDLSWLKDSLEVDTEYPYPGDPYDPGAPVDPIDPLPPVDPIIDPEPPVYIPPRAGLLTSGEWNDNKHFDFLKNLISNGQNPDENFSQYFRDWGLMPFSRLVIHASDETGTAMVNAEVVLTDAEGNVLNRSRTNNEGIAYAYYNLHGGAAVPALITVNKNGSTYTHEITAAELDDTAVIEITGTSAHDALTLDLMFVTDTTGSMMDELEYLQTELEDVIQRVKDQNPNLSLRLSVNFYRDLEDEYVVRSHPFSSDINEELGYLKVEYADGGGDFEEAVEMALDDAVSNHDWREDSIKLMFIILDAPPHNTQEIRTSLSSTLDKAAAMGIRVIPIASSGIDKSTEFFLRTFAMVTGGTYTFLTDDSGIGGGHLTPTVGDYEVEQLNEMIIRLINDNLHVIIY